MRPDAFDAVCAAISKVFDALYRPAVLILLAAIAKTLSS